jgi:hypothetical protein
MRFEDFVAETGAYFADCLVFLGVGVIACEKVGAVDGGAFAAAVESSYYYQVERVADAR